MLWISRLIKRGPSPLLAVLLVLAASAQRNAERGGSRRRSGRARVEAASPAIREPQVGPGQFARRPEQGPPDALGLSARRPAGGDHRGIRDLAAASAIRKAARDGFCIRCCRDAAPRSSRPGKRSRCCSRASDHQQPVAKLSPGVIAALKNCDGEWCRLQGPGFDGYMKQENLWGVYPGEKIQ